MTQHRWTLWFEGRRFCVDRCTEDGCRATRIRWKSGVLDASGQELTEDELRERMHVA